MGKGKNKLYKVIMNTSSNEYVGMYRSWNLIDLNKWQRDYIEQSRDRIKNMAIIQGGILYE